MKTVLVAEDEKAVLRVVGLILRREGYRVLEAESGEAALQISAQHPGPIHLLVSDVAMTGMDGPQLLEALKATRPELRVLYTSGYSKEIIQCRGGLPSGVAFLQKPFDVDVLQRTVRHVLEGGDLNDQGVGQLPPPEGGGL